MQIIFNNGKTFNYIISFALERDFKDGYTRPSLETTIPFEQTTFEEMNALLNSSATDKITYIGDTISYIDENGKTVENTPTSVYENYNVVGKISVEDGNLTFKLYQAISSMEKERNEAIAAVDELLLAMEE